MPKTFTVDDEYNDSRLDKWFKKQVLSKSNTNLILFADEKFNISGLKKHFSNTEYSYISDILKKKDTKKKIVTFDISSKKILLILMQKI